MTLVVRRAHCSPATSGGRIRHPHRGGIVPESGAPAGAGQLDRRRPLRAPVAGNAVYRSRLTLRPPNLDSNDAPRSRGVLCVCRSEFTARERHVRSGIACRGRRRRAVGRRREGQARRRARRARRLGGALSGRRERRAHRRHRRPLVRAASDPERDPASGRALRDRQRRRARSRTRCSTRSTGS